MAAMAMAVEAAGGGDVGLLLPFLWIRFHLSCSNYTTEYRMRYSNPIGAAAAAAAKGRMHMQHIYALNYTIYCVCVPLYNNNTTISRWLISRRPNRTR
jgi:hypothetical protein